MRLAAVALALLMLAGCAASDPPRSRPAEPASEQAPEEEGADVASEAPPPPTASSTSSAAPPAPSTTSSAPPPPPPPAPVKVRRENLSLDGHVQTAVCLPQPGVSGCTRVDGPDESLDQFNTATAGTEWRADVTLTWDTLDPRMQTVRLISNLLPDCRPACPNISGGSAGVVGKSPLRLQTAWLQWPEGNESTVLVLKVIPVNDLTPDPVRSWAQTGFDFRIEGYAETKEA